VPIAPASASGNCGARLAQYRKRASTVIWTGAGLAGLIALANTHLADGAPRVFDGALATLIVLAGATLAKARIEFQWATTKLERALASGNGGVKADGALPADRAYQWPKSGEIAYLAGVSLTALAGLCYLVAVWWPAVNTHVTPW
jgi:hypothetical protein